MIIHHATDHRQDRFDARYAEMLNWQDVVVRALHNPKISPMNFRLYVSLIDTYPQLLTGEGVEIEVGLVRRNAGEAKESSATRFFKDLTEIEAVFYQSEYDKSVGRRRSIVEPREQFAYPESFDTNSSERKRKAREAEEKKRKQFQDPRKQFTCEVCGSYDLEYEATAICKSCQHRHRTVEHIPAADITIEAEMIELADDWSWLDEPTEQRAAVKPGVAVVQASLSAAPVQAEPPEPERRCIKCGRTRRECWYPSAEEPGMWSLHCLD